MNIVKLCNDCKLMEVISSRHADIQPGTMVIYQKDDYSGKICTVVDHTWSQQGKTLIETRHVWFHPDELKPAHLNEETLNLIQYLINQNES